MNIEVESKRLISDSAPGFPCLMAKGHFGDEQIILVTGICDSLNTYIGTNINGVGHPVGHYSESWSPNFIPWYGEIKITGITGEKGDEKKREREGRGLTKDDVIRKLTKEEAFAKSEVMTQGADYQNEMMGYKKAIRLALDLIKRIK
jgi:hypothetical protein